MLFGDSNEANARELCIRTKSGGRAVQILNALLFILNRLPVELVDVRGVVWTRKRM